MENYCHKQEQKILKYTIALLSSIGLLLPLTFVKPILSSNNETINLEGKIVRNDAGYEGLNVTAGSPACVVFGNANDTCDFQVRYYSATTLGTLFLTETFENVEIGQYNGAFNLSLGSGVTTPASYTSLNSMIQGEDNIFIEIAFSPAGDTTYTETFSRMPLQSSAYSIRSKYSSGASGAFQFNTSSNASGYATPSAGMVYYDTTSNTLKIYNGTAWENIASGSSGTNLWSDAGNYTYLTNTTDSFSLGSNTYTAIGGQSYTDYLLGLSSNSPFAFDMGGERLSISGDKSQSGLTVLSSYSGSNAWPLVTFRSDSANFDSTVLNVVQSGTGKIASFSKGDTEAFSFENDQTFYIAKRTDAPSTVTDRIYNVGGALYWNGSAVCTLASGCGNSSLWTDSGAYTYLTSTTDNVGIGGTTPETSKFFFNTSNGRLGIGTSSPNSKLDIVGDGTASNLQEWRDSLGNVLSLINQYGYATFGRSTGGNAILSLGANTNTVPQMNFASSNGVDLDAPTNGDLWWNGTNLYFFNGNEKIDLLDRKERFVVYGLTPHNDFLNLDHNQNTYSMIADGFVCVGGSHDQNCTGGEWKSIDEFGTKVIHTASTDWNGGTSSNVTVNTGDIELTSGSSGIYTSAPISTANAKSYGNISWNEELGSNGNISVQTRSVDSVSGQWSDWENLKKGNINDSDIHTKWQGLSITTDGNISGFLVSEDNNTLYIGGDFSTVNGESRTNLAAIDLSTGLLTDFKITSEFIPSIDTIVLKGSNMYVSGRYSMSSDHITHIDLTTGIANHITTCGRGADIILSGDIIYAKSNYGMYSSYKVKTVNTVTLEVKDMNFSADGLISSIAINGNELYVGGNFTNIGSQNRNYLASVDTDTEVVTSFNPNPNNSISDMLVHNNILYVGGNFTNIESQNRNYLASIDTSTNSVTNFNLNPDNSISNMLLHNDTFYLYGNFANIGGQSRNGLAAIDIGTNSVTDFNSVLPASEPLFVHNNILYLKSGGGGYETINAITGAILKAVPYSQISDGDITRQVVGFEDENELDSTKLTKVISADGEYISSNITENLANYDYLTMWIRSDTVGNSLKLTLGNVERNVRIHQANQWEKVYIDISNIPKNQREDIKSLRITNIVSATQTFYIDNLSAEKIFSSKTGTKIQNSPNQYIQYRVIFTNTDGVSKPKLNDITLKYNDKYQIVYQDANNIRLYNYSGQDQYLKLSGQKEDTSFTSSVVNVDGAVAFEFNTINKLTGRAKLLSINNAGDETMYIDANGNMYIAGDIVNSFGDSKYLALAPTMPQLDTSSSNSIWINKTGTGGDLIRLQTNGSDVFVVNRTGNVTMSGNASVDGGTLTLGNNGNIRFNNATNQIEFSKDGGVTWLKVGDALSKIVLSAEYAGAVLTADGSANTGSMTSDNTGSSSNSMNYYEWNSSELTLNDYDIRVRITLPSNFDIWGSGGITIHYATESTDVSNNKLDAHIFEQSLSVVDANSENNVSETAGTWKTAQISGADLNQCIGANTTCILNLKLSSLGDNYVRVGDIVLDYSRTL